MKNYKIITTPTTTRYVLESATAGATSAGSVASTERPMGSIITREGDKNKNKVPQKPRQGPLRPQTGGGKHKDKKRAEKQGDVKHKKPFMEDHEVSMASNELKSIHANAKKLLALVQQYGEQGDIEAWQQSKITKAADYLNSVLQSIGGEQDALDELKGDPNRPDSKKISHFQNLLKTQKDRFAQQGFARAADDTDKLQKKYREPISELDRPSGTMFLKFMKKQLPDREMALYAFAGFGNTPDDVRSANAKIKPFIVGDVDELEYNVNKIFRDVDFVGVEKMVVDARNVPDGMMPDVEALVDLDDRLEFYVDDSDDDEEDGGGGKMQHYVIGPDGKKRKVPVPGKPSAQVAGSSHNTPVQPKTYKYTLQRTELMPKLRDMGFKFQGNQIILSKQQRDQLVQKLGSQFQSIFSQSDKFTEAGNERNKQNPTRDFLRRYPVPQDQMVRPVKKPEKKKPEQGVAEGSLETDNMVSHIGQVIQSIYPRGGDKNTYMKLVAQEMPRIVKANPKLFRQAFGMAYDRFFHIDQDDDFDYTDYSMRKGEKGVADESYYDRDDYYNARQGGEYGRTNLSPAEPAFTSGDNASHDDNKAPKGKLPADPFGRTTGKVPQYKGQGQIHKLLDPDEQVEEEKQKGVDGKACWKGYKRMGTKKKGGRTVDNCVKVGEDAYMESLWSQLNEYKFTSLPYKGQKKEKQAPFALGSKHIGKAGGSSKSKGALSGMKASTSKDSNKPVVSTEAAPPGDKYERMVKHIKKGYAKDGKITDKERSIAYATAWKAKNKAKK